MKKMLGISLAILLLCQSISMTVFAAQNDRFPKINTYVTGQFADVTEMSWFAPNVAQVYELGLMKGNSSTTFNPSGTLNLAETITMAARLHSIYNTGTETFQQDTPWYKPYVDYAIKNKIITFAYSNYERAVSRAEFATILSNALPKDALQPINTIASNAIPDVIESVSYADAVYNLYRAGVLIGNDKHGTFDPMSTIERSSAAAILTRMAIPALRKTTVLENAPITLSSKFDGIWFSYYVNTNKTLSDHPDEFKQVISVKDHTIYSANIKGDFKSPLWTLGAAGNNMTATYATDYADVFLELQADGTISETRVLYNDKSKKDVSTTHYYTWKHQNSETSDISGNANQDNILSLIALKNSQASEYIYLYKVEKIDFEYNQSVLNIYLPQLNQAQSELAIAQTSMVRIYREGKGFVYEPDASKISAAQTEVDKYQQKVDYYEEASALNQETMRILDEQLQFIQAEIRTLEESLK
ncbi:MAG: S-layer homology domain-containing protein [Anaerovoracaceae bacterium]